MGKYTVKLEGVFDKVGDVGFSIIKHKFVQNKNSFVISKRNFQARGLFEIICSSDVMDNLDRRLFAKLPRIFIYSYVFETNWFADKYCKTILEILKKLEEYTLSDRALLYYNHLKGTMIPEYSIIAKEKEVNGRGFLEALIDIYKVSSALLNYLDNDVGFSVDVSRGLLENLENRIAESTKKDTIYYNDDERIYARFFSWILTEIICEQDGITSEAGEEE